MCRQVTCRRCGKATWAGCGRHVSQAMAGVPASRQCSCPPEQHRSVLDRFLRR